MPHQNNQSFVFDEIVWGVDGIAKKIKRTKRQTQHLIDQGKIHVTYANPKTLITTNAQLEVDAAAMLSGLGEESD
jgi:hypothetical protein